MEYTYNAQHVADVSSLAQPKEQSAHSRCLNCNETLPDGIRFCPQCGQPTDTGRLGSKDLAINSLGTLTRLNKGVFFTCFNLLWRPWKVIADYIHGQRVNYADPVKLLIGLCFILIGLKAMFHLGDFESQPTPIDAAADSSSLAHFMRFFVSSDTLQYLLVFLPVAPVIMIANRKNHVFHYNLAECFVGALYMSDTTLIIELLCLPLLAMGLDISAYLILAYLTVMGSVLIYKSFRHFGLRKIRCVGKTIGVIMMIALSYFLLIILFSIIMTMWAILTHKDEFIMQGAQ